MGRTIVSSGRLRTLVLLSLLLPLGACALGAPPAEQVLDPRQADDERCAAAITRFRERPKDVDGALATARVLFASVDRDVQQALVEHAEGRSFGAAKDVLAAEDELPEAVRDRVLSLSGIGAEAAQVAVDARPDDVEAHVLLAQHLSFVAWANGPMRSLMAGYGARITAAMQRALELDATWDHGAPLRLRGRFLAEAPWPLRDLDAAGELLQRAVAVRSMPIHHLFLGDLRCQRGDGEGAREQWRLVATSTPDDSTALVAPWHRRMAELRLAAGR